MNSTFCVTYIFKFLKQNSNKMYYQSWIRKTYSCTYFWDRGRTINVCLLSIDMAVGTCLTVTCRFEILEAWYRSFEICYLCSKISAAVGFRVQRLTISLI
ncbi:hypothetical protein EE612_055515 [Oryza sativa]|nr:hypothetical protein EE612_055515 [Oryza sativa]